MTTATAARTIQPQELVRRVIELLRSKRLGAELTAVVIAHEFESDPTVVINALAPAVAASQLAMRKFGRGTYYKVGRAAGPARPAAADDEQPDPDEPKQRVVSAAAAGPVAKTAAASVFEQAKPAKATRAKVDRPPLVIEDVQIRSGVPIPPTKSGNGLIAEKYRALIARMKPGDSCELPAVYARGLMSVSKKDGKVKLSIRKLTAETSAVWRVS